MEVWNLKIRRFRGVESLDWDVGGKFVCLIGPGDSTKSTILDAAELALTPRRTVRFEDSDFYDADTSQPLTIEMTVGGIPAELLSDTKFGYMIKGGSESSVISDEPTGDDRPLLTVRLTVDASLEPEWFIVNSRVPDGRRISAADRERFGVVRIGAYADSQFSWGQGSALSRLMDEREEVRPILAGLRRQAKASLDTAELPKITASAKQAEEIGKMVGVAPRTADGFVPHLDIGSLSMSASVLSLHDGKIPLRQAGLGSARLLATGLQYEAARRGGMTMIDEVEHGLEPHRIRGLLGFLQRTSAVQTEPAQGNEESEEAEGSGASILLTTHSPIVLGELETSQLRVVRSKGGATTVKTPPPHLRPLLRKNPDAFLSKTVIVCEGRTELGLCRALDRWWAPSHGSFGYRGVALADGGGNTSGPAFALALAGLGYQTAFFGDSDVAPTPDEATMRAGGVSVFLWPGQTSLEGRVASDLPWNGFVRMAQLAIDERQADHVLAKLAAALGCRPPDLAADPNSWATGTRDEQTIRAAFAAAASAKGAEWFKRVDLAQALGGVVVSCWQDLAGTPLRSGIEKLELWLSA